MRGLLNNLVSIIVPVYNVEKYIEFCLKSIINQSYTDIEILLIDDGSTDKSGEVCDKYARKYQNIRAFHKDNGGLSDARNYGMRYAVGEWITFVDSDDILHKDFINNMVTAARKAKLDIVVCDHYMLTEKNIEQLPQIKMKKENKVEIWEEAEATKELLYQKTFTTSAWGKLYKTVLFENILFPVGRLHEDVGTIYKVFEKARRVGYINQKLYFYLQRNQSITHSFFSRKKMDYVILTKEIIEHFRINNDMLTSAAISRHFSACFQVILSCPNTQEWKEEYRMLKSEIETYAPCVKRDKNARLRNRIIACIAQKNTDLAICLCKYIYKHRN